jgi:hypothetical protein
MREREFDSQDIQHILQFGKYDKGYWEAQEQNHEFSVLGMDLNGEELELECALYTGPTEVVVVTGKRAK